MWVSIQRYWYPSSSCYYCQISWTTYILFNVSLGNSILIIWCQRQVLSYIVYGVYICLLICLFLCIKFLSFLCLMQCGPLVCLSRSELSNVYTRGDSRNLVEQFPDQLQLSEQIQGFVKGGACLSRSLKQGVWGTQSPRSYRVTLFLKSKNDINHEICIAHSHLIATISVKQG